MGEYGDGADREVGRVGGIVGMAGRVGKTNGGQGDRGGSGVWRVGGMVDGGMAGSGVAGVLQEMWVRQAERMMLAGEGGEGRRGQVWWEAQTRGHWEEVDVEEGSPAKTKAEPSGTGGQDEGVGRGREARGCRGGRYRGHWEGKDHGNRGSGQSTGRSGAQARCGSRRGPRWGRAP